MKTYKSLQSFLALSLLVCFTLKPVIGDLVDTTLNTASNITNNTVDDATQISEDIVNVPGEIIGNADEVNEENEIIGNADEVNEGDAYTTSAIAAPHHYSSSVAKPSSRTSGKAEYALQEEYNDFDDDGFDSEDDFDDFDDEFDEDYAIYEYDDEDDYDLD